MIEDAARSVTEKNFFGGKPKNVLYSPWEVKMHFLGYLRKTYFIFRRKLKFDFWLFLWKRTLFQFPKKLISCQGSIKWPMYGRKQIRHHTSDTRQWCLLLLLYEMTFLDPSAFAIWAALSMSLVKHYSVTYPLGVMMGRVIMTSPPYFSCRCWKNLIWICKDIVIDIIPINEWIWVTNCKCIVSW